MATVWVPSLLRPLCGGAHTVAATGATLADVIDDLDARYPGVAARLVDAGRLRPGLAVWIDGDEADSLRATVAPTSEVQIVPAIAGG
jgi:molybdopterin converting factor small subunit